MRALLLTLAAALWALPAAAAPPAAPSSEATVAVAAVPLGAGPGGAALVGRFSTLLPQTLGRVGFPLLDPRQVDLRLSERPDLLAGCHRDSQREACLLGQAQLLGVSRLILPRLKPIADGLGIALTLYEITEAAPPQPARVERLVEVVELCRPCQNAELQAAVERVATALRKGLLLELEAHLEISARPRTARLLVDGREVGRGEASVPVPPGPHVIVAEGPGGRGEQRVTLGPKERQRVELLAISGPAPSPERPPSGPPPRPLAVAKWVLAGVGLGALAVGTTLWALDGRPSCSLAPGQLRCPEVLDSAGAGIGLFAIGAASLGASGVLFGIDYRRGREGDKTALLSLGGRF